MRYNVGTADAMVRVLIGLAILTLIFFLEGNVRLLALLGLVPLLTGLSGVCPLYSLFGINTCKAPAAKT